MIRTFALIAPGSAALVLALSLPLAAQETQVQMTGLRQNNSDAPVEVTSDNLSVDQTAGLAIFTGNVIVIQDTLRMTAPRVDVTYAKNPDGSTGTTIDNIHAMDGVLLTTPTEAADGEDAVYDPETGKIVMTKDVLLTQGPNSIKGQKLDFDVNTGQGLMSGGRVRSVFQSQPKEGGN